MQGIDFITDEKGKKKAVVIDLQKHRDLVEDLIDGIVAANRLKKEKPKRDFSAMKNRVLKAVK